MRISDWSSDVCSSDLDEEPRPLRRPGAFPARAAGPDPGGAQPRGQLPAGAEACPEDLAAGRRLPAGPAWRDGGHRPAQAGAADRPVRPRTPPDRKSVDQGKGESVRVYLGGLRIHKKK